HGFIGHAGAERPVANHGDRLAGTSRQLVGYGKTERRGDRGGTVRRSERVIFALAAPGEAAEAPALSQRADAVPPAGDDLVRIGLMADIPDQFVARRVEHIMQRYGQLDHTEPRAEVPTGGRNGGNRLLAQLVGELRQLLLVQRTQVAWEFHRVEQRSYGTVTHRG